MLVLSCFGSKQQGGFVHDTVTRFMGSIVIAMVVQFALTSLKALMAPNPDPAQSTVIRDGIYGGSRWDGTATNAAFLKVPSFSPRCATSHLSVQDYQFSNRYCTRPDCQAIPKPAITRFGKFVNSNAGDTEARR